MTGITLVHQKLRKLNEEKAKEIEEDGDAETEDN